MARNASRMTGSLASRRMTQVLMVATIVGASVMATPASACFRKRRHCAPICHEACYVVCRDSSDQAPTPPTKPNFKPIPEPLPALNPLPNR